MGECIIDQILRVVVFFRLQDYLLCLVCGFVAYGVSKARPHCRPFSWTDSTIDFPYGGSGTFPSWTLPLIAVLPGIAYVVAEAVRHLLWLPRHAKRAAATAELHSLRVGDAQRHRGATGSSSNGSGHSRFRDGTEEGEEAAGVLARQSEGAAQSLLQGRSSSPFSTTVPQPPAETQIAVEVAGEEGLEEEKTAKKCPSPAVASLYGANEVEHNDSSSNGGQHEDDVEVRRAEVASTVTPIGAPHRAASGTSASSPVYASAPGMTNRSAPSPRPQNSLRAGLPQSTLQTHLTAASNNSGSREMHVTSPTASAAAARHTGASSRSDVPLRTPLRRFLAHAHMWVLTQAFAVTFAMLLTDTIKVYAGRLRPDFLSRLRREGYTADSLDVDWCKVGKGGRVSFPSGHSSISFAAFVPFSFYVLHTLHVFRRGGTSLWCVVVGLVPLILPITVAVSRTRDNRHNFDDILAGSLIGIACALLAVKANLVVNGRTGQLMPRLPMRE